MAMSPHPLVGLPHRCNVVRRVPTDDGAGGVFEDGSEATVYSSRQCRIASLDPNDVELKGFGFDPKSHMKVVMVYSPKVQEIDFLSIPFGVPPNVLVPIGLSGSFASSYVISTPAGNKTLTWDGTVFKDSSGDYVVGWDSVKWVFWDHDAGVTWHFDGFTQSQDIFKRDWSEIGDYAVVRRTGESKPYRIVWLKHQIDENGRTHHTSLVIDLEENDE